MNSRERFQKACRRQKVDRPPVWLMRQAGRYLPEYQKIKLNHDFMEMCRTPDMAIEISLQPWRRFGVDAVIVFSDILIPCEAMGQKLYFDDQGPHLSPAIQSPKELSKLAPFDPSRTGFLFETLSSLRKELGDKAALIGFCGSPWTTAVYMVEGGSSPGSNQLKIHTLIQKDPKLIHSLLEKVTESLIPYLKGQIKSGIDLVQVFDTWGGSVSPSDYNQFVKPYTTELIRAIKGQVPVTLYCQNCDPILEQMVATGCDVVSIDWRLLLSEARKRIPKGVGLQGNLDPQILFKSPEEIKQATQAMLQDNGDHPGYIANLGHGVVKGTPVESVKTFVETVKNFSANNSMPSRP